MEARAAVGFCNAESTIGGVSPMHSHLYPVDDRVEIDVNRLFFRAPLSSPGKQKKKRKEKEICVTIGLQRETTAEEKKRKTWACRPVHRDIVQITTQTHNMMAKVGGWIETMNCAVPARCTWRFQGEGGGKEKRPPTSFPFESTGFLTVRHQCYWPHY